MNTKKLVEIRVIRGKKPFGSGMSGLAPKTPTVSFILREAAGAGFWVFPKKLFLSSGPEPYVFFLRQETASHGFWPPLQFLGRVWLKSVEKLLGEDVLVGGDTQLLSYVDGVTGQPICCPDRVHGGAVAQGDAKQVLASLDHVDDIRG